MSTAKKKSRRVDADTLEWMSERLACMATMVHVLCEEVAYALDPDHKPTSIWHVGDANTSPGARRRAAAHMTGKKYHETEAIRQLVGLPTIGPAKRRATR